MNDYEFDLHIDENALDVEWLRQPELMLKYSDMQARAKMELARIKEKVSVVKAEVANKIRKDPEKYGLDKVTDKGIEMAVSLQKEYKNVFEEQMEAQYELDMAYGAVASVDQRRSALENLVKLLGHQYYAGPKAPRNLNMERNARQERQKRVDGKVSIKKKKFKRN